MNGRSPDSFLVLYYGYTVMLKIVRNTSLTHTLCTERQAESYLIKPLIDETSVARNLAMHTNNPWYVLNLNISTNNRITKG